MSLTDHATIADTLLPMWPVYLTFAAAMIGASWLWWLATRTHSQTWCEECQQRCDPLLPCECCERR